MKKNFPNIVANTRSKLPRFFALIASYSPASTFTSHMAVTGGETPQSSRADGTSATILSRNIAARYLKMQRSTSTDLQNYASMGIKQLKE